jgi:hypothetical protein
MPDFLTSPFSNGIVVNPWHVIARMILALLLGATVAWIYVRTTRRPELGRSSPTTLVLLTVLIAMVTQVIGDNVARAFSLVGALSIVRFRTVVRDTRDTAFVIFAVVIGMAVGAKSFWVAGVGIAIVGVTAFVMARRPEDGTAGASDPPSMLRVRLALGMDIERLAGEALNAQLRSRDLVSVSTAKHGASVDYVFEATLKPGTRASELVAALNRLEGVQDVHYYRQGFEES